MNRFIVKVGNLYWSGNEEILESSLEDAFVFSDEDKELKFWIDLGVYDCVEHWAQQSAERLNAYARVLMLTDDNQELEEAAE